MNKKSMIKMGIVSLIAAISLFAIFFAVSYSGSSSAETDNKIYILGESVRFDLGAGNHSVKIATPNETYIKMTSDESLIFVPKEIGNYYIEISGSTGIKVLQFAVVEKNNSVAKENNSSANSVASENSSTVKENLSSENDSENNSESNNSENFISDENQQIEIGKPVRWVENNSFPKTDKAIMRLPDSSTNISVYRIKNGERNKINFTENPKSFAQSILSVVGINANKTISLSNVEGEVEVEYYTEAPKADEVEISSTEKKVSVSSSFHYTNVLAYTNITGILPLSKKNLIKVHWNEENRNLDFNAYDTNGDGLIDQISWIIPHLSDQTFDIIIATKAEELDSSRQFIGDVYDYIKNQDNNYTEIPDGNYLRVSFERNLTKENDITLYARGTGNIEVYKKDSSDLITTFNISGESFYKNFLTNMDGKEDTFDLKSVGDVSYDYIVDPTIYIRAGIGATNSSGNLQPSFATAMPSVNYAPLISGESLVTRTMYSMVYANKSTTGFVIGAQNDQGNNISAGNLDWAAIQFGDFTFGSNTIKCGTNTSSLSGGLNRTTFPSAFPNTNYAVIANSIWDGDSPAINLVAGSKTTTYFNVSVRNDGAAAEAIREMSYCAFTIGEYTISGLQIKAGNTTTAAAGDTTVSFGAAFPNTNYAVLAMAEQSGTTNCAPEIVTKNVGSFTIHFESDAAANCASRIFSWVAIQTGTFTLDQTNPLVSIKYPGNVSYNVNVSALNYTASDDVALDVCKYSLNGAANTTVACGTNATGLTSTEGSNTWTVYVNDTSGNKNSSNITFFKDTIFPLISFGTGTENNGVNKSQNWVYVNVTVTEANEKNITFSLFNSSGTVNATTFTNGQRTINWTNLIDNKYFYNVTITDNVNNVNYTSTYNITLDDTNPLVSFGTGTNASGTYDKRNWVYVNVSVTEANEQNITFFLFNSSGSVNASTFTTKQRTINWTTLPDGIYFYNVTVADNVNNVNSTSTYNITLDNTPPLISFGTGVEVDGANKSQNWVYVNVSVTELNERNLTFNLYNSSGPVNASTFTNKQRTINWTGLPNGNYWYNVTIYDNVSNVNYTSTNKITLDTTNPLISFGTGTNVSGTYDKRNWVYVNVSVTEANEQNITFFLFNSSGPVNTSTFTTKQRTINWTTLPDGIYFYNVTVADNVNNVNSTSTYNITLDNTPPLISFGTGTENNASNKSQNWVYVNVTVTELNERNITFNLYNSTSTVNSTTFTNKQRTINWTGLPNGNYWYNVTIYDNVSNVNYTSTYKITLDTTNPLISFGTGTEVDSANKSQTWVYVNVSVTELNENNITFNLYNSSSTVNSTTFTTKQRTINWTGLPDGSYWYNVTVLDAAGRSNSTSTRKITLDNTNPTINITYPKNLNYSVNVSVLNYAYSDLNPGRCWYSNSSGAWNSSSVAAGTNLSATSIEGWNNWTLYCNDTVGNLNFSSVRFLKDTINPQLVITYPKNATYQSDVSSLNYTASDSNLQSCWYSTNNGQANTSVSCGTNITGLTSGWGSNKWIIWANDSVGNVNMTSVTFTKSNATIFFDTRSGNGTSVGGAASITFSSVMPSSNYSSLMSGYINANTMFSLAYLNKAPDGFDVKVEADGGGNLAGSFDWAVFEFGDNTFDGNTIKCGVGPGASGTITFASAFLDTNYVVMANPIDDSDTPLVNFVGGSKTTSDFQIDIEDDQAGQEAVGETDYCAFTKGEYVINGVQVKTGSSTTAGSGDTTVTFGAAFSNASYSVLAMAQAVVGTPCAPEIVSKSVGSFSIHFEDDGGVNCPNKNFDWIAIPMGESASADVTTPLASITYPQDIHNYSANVVSLNYTYSDLNPGRCWYSNSSGAWNSSSVAAGTNLSATSIEGWNNWTLYCNDTSGNMNVSAIGFIKDTMNPLVSISQPQNITYSSELIPLSFSVSDSTLDTCKYSLDNGVTNVSLPGCANSSFSYVNPSGAITLYANDSFGRENSSTVTFSVDPNSIKIRAASPSPVDRTVGGKYAVIIYNPTNSSVSISGIMINATEAGNSIFNGVTQGAGNSYPTSGWAMGGSDDYATWTGSQTLGAGQAIGFWVRITSNSIGSTFRVRYSATVDGTNYFDPDDHKAREYNANRPFAALSFDSQGSYPVYSVNTSLFSNDIYNITLSEDSNTASIATGSTLTIIVPAGFTNIADIGGTGWGAATINGNTITVSTTQNLRNNRIEYAFSATAPSTGGLYMLNASLLSTYGTAVLEGAINVISNIAAPTVSLVAPANGATSISQYGTTFSYNVSDNSDIANCTLFINNVGYYTDYNASLDTNIHHTPYLDNGNYNWNVNCTNIVGMQTGSEVRSLTVAVPYITQFSSRWYETTTSNFVAPAVMNLSNTRDATQNTVAISVPNGKAMNFIHAYSPFMGANGLILNAGTVSFSAIMATTTNGRNNEYITWEVYVSNNTGDYLICRAGNNNTGGTRITATGALGYTASCANSKTVLQHSDRIELVMNVYNAYTGAITTTHYVDATRNSYVDFSGFVQLGDLNVSLISPATDLTLNTGQTFNVSCKLNCTVGSCLNTNAYVQYNGTGDWTNIGASGNLILNTGATNPHALGNITSTGIYTNFSIKANSISVNSIRCIATSDYSNFNDTTTRSINISVGNQPPILNITNPQNNYWFNSSSVVVYYNASDVNNNIANSTLFINGAFNQSNSSGILNGGISNFTLTMADGNYTLSVNVSDTTNLTVNSSILTVHVDTIFPSINLSYPAAGSSISQSFSDFNFTVSDSADNNLVCNMTLGSFNYTNISAYSGNVTRINVTSIGIGIHYWNVTCWDHARNLNISKTYNFTVQDLPPTVNLTSGDNLFFNTSTVVLYYNASDNNKVNSTLLVLNGAANLTNQSGIINGGINNFTLTLSDGKYNWTVNATDNVGLVSQAVAAKYFIVDTHPPVINLTSPPDNSQTNSSIVNFNFTVTDITNITCNLTVDSLVLYTNFSVTSGVPKNRTLNLTDGYKYWNVTCWDQVGNINTSSTYRVNITEYPKVALNTSNDSWFNYNSINLSYIPSDNTNLSSCNLYINGVFNITNQSAVRNGQQNNFSVTFNSGKYLWSVICNDTINLINATENRTFYIDTIGPSISLLAPADGSPIFTANVNFNVNVTDNLATNMTCNLTISNSSNKIFYALTGANTTVNYTFSDGGLRFWNVTCIDKAGNANTSITQNFTLAYPPGISMTSPNNSYWFNSSSVVIYYNATDINDNIANSTLFINGQPNMTNQTAILNGLMNNFTLDLGDGNYSWSINITDTTNLFGNSSTRTFYVDTHPPLLILNSPSNNDVVSWNNITFNFNVTDNLANISICNVSIDESPEPPYNVNAKPGTNLFYAIRSDGNYSWSVTCYDYAGNINASEEINFSVFAPPNVTLDYPTPNLFTKNSSINFLYTPYDPIDILNCSLYIDDILNDTDSEPKRNLQNKFSVDGIQEGTHNWTVECTDSDSNLYAPPVSIFTMDISPPNITLNNPVPDDNIDYNVGYVRFNFTATDAYIAPTCNLTIDGKVNKSNIIMTSGMSYKWDVGLKVGAHLWNVTCWDYLNNVNTSETRAFNVSLPDFMINESSIAFDNSNPEENNLVKINGTVFNIGSVDSKNVSLKFYNGNPDSGGTLIYSTTVNISSQSYAMVNASVNSSLGIVEVFLEADTPLSTNGSFKESNESNNAASKNLTTSTWEYFYGFIDSRSSFVLANNQSKDVIKWNASEFENGNIFVTDSESNVNWAHLQAIGRNMSNGNATNDFADIDSLLGTTNYPDSIYKIFTDSGNVRNTSTLDIFGKEIDYVPVINSINDSNFFTGILWDYSSDTNGQFDQANKENLIFASAINKNADGTYGKADYEIRVPVKLRAYIGPDLKSVSFYSEID